MGKHYPETQDKYLSMFRRARPRTIEGWSDRCPRVEYRVFTAKNGDQTAFLTMPQCRITGNFGLAFDAWVHTLHIDVHLPLYGICIDKKDRPIRAMSRRVIQNEIARQCADIRAVSRNKRADPWVIADPNRSRMLWFKKKTQPVRTDK